MRTLDELDRKLIAELQQDAYRTHASLAQMLGVSKTTITRRIQRLLDNGTLRIIGVLDASKIGLNTSALIGLNVNLRNSEAIISHLTTKPQVHLLALVTGRYDIVIGVTVGSTAELAQFVTKDVASIDGVQSSETLFALEIKKQTYVFSS